jgi:hypothetical protein
MTDHHRKGAARTTCAAARWALAALVASAVASASVARTAFAQEPVPGAARDSAVLAQVTTPLRVTDLGPGLSGRMLRSILLRPHVVFRGDTARALVLDRDTAFATSVVVLGGDAAVASRVRGDVVVIGGDLYLRPGARVEGRAIAFGGAVYRSSLSVVRDEAFSYRDHTFLPTEGAGSIALAYQDLERHPIQPIAFPAYGLQLPEYTRVDGLALGWGPTITLAEGGVVIVPTATWRTHLGEVDPRATAAVKLGRRVRLVADAGRGTFSNDRWIRANLVNSFTTLLAGVDTRNYFRADRAEVRGERTWESATAMVAPFVGARVERAWSVGPDTTATSAPFTILKRRDRERILRPNPRVVRGNIASALAGATLDWESPQGVSAGAALQLEQAFGAPGDASAFTQVSAHLELALPTFRTHDLSILVHAVGTAGDAPPQRWAYLGGNGTLLTLDLLELGGDQLLYVESQYNIPIDRIRIPLAGAPILSLRHGIGSAGVGRLPSFTQNLGVRLTIAVLRFDYTIDPSTRDGGFDVSFTMPF